MPTSNTKKRLNLAGLQHSRVKLHHYLLFNFLELGSWTWKYTVSWTFQNIWVHTWHQQIISIPNNLDRFLKWIECFGRAFEHGNTSFSLSKNVQAVWSQAAANWTRSDQKEAAYPRSLAGREDWQGDNRPTYLPTIKRVERREIVTGTVVSKMKLSLLLLPSFFRWEQRENREGERKSVKMGGGKFTVTLQVDPVVVRASSTSTTTAAHQLRVLKRTATSEERDGGGGIKDKKGYVHTWTTFAKRR